MNAHAPAAVIGKSIAPPPSSGTVHVIMTTLIGMIVTALCCYTFYVFRTGSQREQTIAEAVKAMRATSEIAVSVAERGLPGVRSRLDELETRGRMIEQHQKKTGAIIERLTSSSAATATAVGAETLGASSAAVTMSEADMLATRRAARASQPTGPANQAT